MVPYLGCGPVYPDPAPEMLGPGLVVVITSAAFIFIRQTAKVQTEIILDLCVRVPSRYARCWYSCDPMHGRSSITPMTIADRCACAQSPRVRLYCSTSACDDQRPLLRLPVEPRILHAFAPQRICIHVIMKPHYRSQASDTFLSYVAFFPESYRHRSPSYHPNISYQVCYFYPPFRWA